MPGPNTTGLPSTSDYYIGRGALYFQDSAGSSWRHLGNAPEFNLSMEKEELEHRSSLSGLKTIDKTVVISQDANFTFQLEEINNENLAAALSGETADHTNVAIAGFAQFEMVPAGEIELGRWYDIVNSSGARAYDISASDVAIETGTGAVALVEDTDYTLDLEMGRIFLLSTSTVLATAISGGEGLDVTLTANGNAGAVSEVRMLTQTSISGALKYIGINPANDDEQLELQLHQITMSSEGDIAWISDEFTNIPFSGKAQKDLVGHPTSPTGTIRTVGIPGSGT